MPQVVLKLADDISTDIIYPGRYLATVLPSETAQFTFADFAEFNARLKTGEISAGSVIVAGKNFGCGSSREQAASCLKGANLTVVAHHFARIFLQNAINLGLNIVICPDLEVQEGDELEFTSDIVINRNSEKQFFILPLPATRQSIIDAGGLIPYTRQRLLQNKKGMDVLKN